MELSWLLQDVIKSIMQDLFRKDGAQSEGQEISRFLRKIKLHYQTNRRRDVDPMHSQLKSVKIFTPY